MMYVVVVTRQKDDCHGGPVEVNAVSSGGYLASVVTEETGCGSPDSPWLLRAPGGQRIQLSLLDFDLATRQSRTAAAAAASDRQQSLICHVRALPTGHTDSLRVDHLVQDDLV